MSLFQKSVLNSIKQDESLVALRWAAFQNYIAKIDAIRGFKEEVYQDGFFKDIFESCLGYTLKTTNPADYNLEREKKNETDGKKADGVIYVNDEVIGVVELKDQKTKNLDQVEAQAFNYHASHSNSKYIIISNFDELRFYIDKKTAYEKFNLFNLSYDDFRTLHLLIGYESICDNIPLKLKEKSTNFEQTISKELYRDFSAFRTHLFENIFKNNDMDRSLLLRLTQKLCDRIIFILFAEDRELLKKETIKEIRTRHASDGFGDRSLYDYYKLYFNAINTGNDKLGIPKYNGGLFATDELLDSLTIDDAYLDIKAQKLSDFDFVSEISVNILGHIFEQSLTDLEEMNATIHDTEFDKKKSKRKKDGVFYTPEYITRYIVENTLGKLCEDKKTQLFGSGTSVPPINPKKLTKDETKEKENLLAYREWLNNLKILDPACGSGAFLNQALEFLIREHTFIRDLLLPYEDLTIYYEIEKSILEHNLYGVDINEDAVEIARLSLWLRTAHKGRELINLGTKIKCGNSLISDRSVAENAFAWEEEFPEVFAQGGFDVVIGNPPYVRQELFKQYSDYLEKNYETFNGKADLYVYFFEKALKLIVENGYLGFISSGKFFEANYGKEITKYLFKNSKIDQIIDFGDKEVFEGISAYPLILITQHSTVENYSFKYVKNDSENFDSLDTLENKFLILNLNAFLENDCTFVDKKIDLLIKKIYSKSVHLTDYIGMPTVGIKTGFNDGFVYDSIESEYEYLKPYVFGKNIKRYAPLLPKDKIIFPYKRKNNGYTLCELDELQELKNYLITHQILLSNRAMIKEGIEKGNKIFYEFQQINKKLNFENEYIIYPNVSLGANFTLSKGNLVDMTGFIIQSNCKFLLCILNSKITAYLMDLWAISRRGGYREYKNQYIQKIPIPKASEEDQQVFILNADLMLELNKQLQAAKQSFLNELHLEKIPQKLQNFDTLEFDDFVKEYSKSKKIKFADKLEERNFKNDWSALFENDKKAVLTLKAEIAQTDKKIDSMVYALYGLSADEIAIVEGVL